MSDQRKVKRLSIRVACESSSDRLILRNLPSKDRLTQSCSEENHALPEICLDDLQDESA